MGLSTAYHGIVIAALKEADRQTEAVHLLEQLAENAVRQNRLEEAGGASLGDTHPPLAGMLCEMIQEPFSQTVSEVT